MDARTGWLCPRCGTSVSPDHATCPGCAPGRPLPLCAHVWDLSATVPYCTKGCGTPWQLAQWTIKLFQPDPLLP